MFSHKPIRIALAATVSEFFTVGCVEPIERALAESLAGERRDLLPVVVARLAEVMGTEAEPPGSLAAVAALVHDEVGSMLRAVSHTDLHTVLLAETADEIFGLSLVWLFLDLFVSSLDLFVCFLLLDTSCTIPHTTVVRQLALVALVVLKFEESKLFQLVIEFFSLFSDTLALVEPLNESLMLDTILDHAVHPGTLLNDVVGLDGKVFFLSHLLVASRAVDKVAVYCFARIPLSLHLRVETVSVEDVFAAKLNTSTVSERLSVAKSTEIVESYSQSGRFVLLLAVFM